jgi:hypothetical protein
MSSYYDALRLSYEINALLRPGTPMAANAERLLQKLIAAAHSACDHAELDVANDLLANVETVLTRQPSISTAKRRQTVNALVAAYERIWHLRHAGHATPPHPDGVAEPKVPPAQLEQAD